MKLNIEGIVYDLTISIAAALVASSLISEPHSIKSIEMNTPQQVKSSTTYEFSFDFKYEAKSE